MEGIRKEKAAHLSLAHEASMRAVAPRFTLDRDALRARRVVLPDDTTPAASAFRMLRTQVLHQVRRQGFRALGVVSGVSGEGKTLTAVNLALALAAEPNQTVLLVDLDLRRPSVGRLLGVPEGDGLEACIRGERNIEHVLWRCETLPRLGVITANPMGVASSELVAGERLRVAMQELRHRYDDRLILVDLPPVLLADDALTISTMLDAVLLVVAEGVTRREDALRVCELLGDKPRLGTVLNRAHEVEQRLY